MGAGPRPGAAATGSSREAARVTALLCGLGTAAFLAAGAQRSYDLDSSITVGEFVATRSPLDAFTHAFALTNHVLFSFLEHLVYSATGSQSEPVMRALPITFSAVTAAAVGWHLARRWGVLAAGAGVAVMVTNPMFAFLGSDVRGYSLLVLAAVVTSVIVLRAARTGAAPSLAARLGYGAMAAVGLATHLHMLGVLAVHTAVVLPNRRLRQRFLAPALGAVTLAAVAYTKVWDDMRLATQDGGRLFRPTFPRDAFVAVVGGSVVATVALLALVGPELWVRRRQRTVQIGLSAIVGVVIFVWAWAPFDLYPRFFVWLVPLPAIAVASAVGRRRTLVLLAALVVTVQVANVWPRLVHDPFANREPARVAREVRAAGGRACVATPYAWVRLLGYTTALDTPTGAQITACDVLVGLGSFTDRDRNAALARVFPHRVDYRGEVGAVVWSKLPFACWRSRAAAHRCAAHR